MNQTIWSAALILMCFFLYAQESPKTYPRFSVKPQEGFVYNENIAKGIAEAVIKGLVGEHFAKYKEPYKALLDTSNGVWIITGCPPRIKMEWDSTKNPPKVKSFEVTSGDNFELRIRKDDGQILDYKFHR